MRKDKNQDRAVTKNLPEMNQSQISDEVSDMFYRILSSSGEAIHQEIDRVIKNFVEASLQKQANSYANTILGCGLYQRREDRLRKTYRSGTKEKSILWRGLKMAISFVKTRSQTLIPEAVSALENLSEENQEELREAWLRGLSSRDMSAMSEKLFGKNVSHTKIMNIVNDVNDDVSKWRNASLANEHFDFLFLDGFFTGNKRKFSTVSSECLLIAMGVKSNGEKQILAFELAPSESIEAWERLLELLFEIKKLDKSKIKMVISDGSLGIIQAVNRVMPSVKRQRCVLHKMRNIIGTTPMRSRGEICSAMKNIWHAPNKAAAIEEKNNFVGKFKEKFPKVVSVLEDDFEATIQHYDFSPSLWPALRTSNVLERFNRELRKKFREIGYSQGENALIRQAGQLMMWWNENNKDKPVKGFVEKRKKSKT
jgi:transposase-like protein